MNASIRAHPLDNAIPRVPVAVCVRLRPLLEGESAGEGGPVVGGDGTLEVDGASFAYDGVFGGDADGRAVYGGLCSALIASALETGVNACIFAWGPTVRGPEGSPGGLHRQRGLGEEVRKAGGAGRDVASMAVGVDRRRPARPTWDV
jgi:hypothetical protein